MKGKKGVPPRAGAAHQDAKKRDFGKGQEAAKRKALCRCQRKKQGLLWKRAKPKKKNVGPGQAPSIMGPL